MKSMKRIVSLLLCGVMLLGYVPMSASAQELCGHHPEHTEECGYVEGESPCTFSCAECTAEPLEEPSVSEPGPMLSLTVAPVTMVVRVSFNCTPEETLVWVYDTADEDTELEPEEDGSYLLVPGDYTYVAFCEGYTGAYEELVVEESSKDIVVDVVLELNKEDNDSTVFTTLTNAEITAKLDQLKSTYYEGYVSGIQCYQFARDLAYNVFGSSPGNPCYLSEGYDSNGWNMIRNPSASDVVLGPGDIIDCRYIYNSEGSTTGHTAIVWKISDGQVYVAESWGSQNGKVHWGLMECQSKAATLSGILEIYGEKFGAENIYIFKRPGAGNSSSGYLSQCTYYPSYLTIEMTTSDYAWTLPCSDQTNSSSQHASSNKLPVGKTLQVTGLYKNTVTTSDHYWYRVDLDGTVAYVYMPYTSIVDDGYDSVQNSVSISGTMPIDLTINKSFPADWTIKSPKLDIYSISAYVYGGTNYESKKFGDIMTEINAKEKNLNYSKIDNALAFNTLPEGKYKLTIQVVLHNYHSTGGNNIDHGLIYKTFTYYFTENQPDHTHSYSSTVVAPTCTEQGYTEYTCSCGASYRDNYTSAKGHIWKVGTVTVEPTCTEQGERIDTCSSCSATRKTILVVGHSYIETVIAGTCTQRPGTKYDCSRCGDSYTVWDESSWSEWSTEYPSDYAEDDIEVKVQYRYRDKEMTTSSSSTLEGWTLLSSEEVWGEYGPWSEWSRTYVAASDSTQVETASLYRYYYFLCLGCGDHNPLSSACGCGSTSNSWNERDSTIPYTQCNSSVVSYATYKRQTTSLGDGQLWYFSSGNLNDTAVGTVDSNSSATVINQGYRYRTRTQSTVYNFYRWGEWNEWSDAEVESSDTREVEMRRVYRYNIYAKGQHSWDAGTVTIQPTCTTEGEKGFICDVCGETRTEAVPATSHTEVKDKAVAATCTTAGKTEGSHCSICNAVINAQTTIPAIGHSYESMVTAPTCTEQGYTTHTCVNCGDSYEDSYVAAAGHSFGDWYVAAESTCLTEGQERRDCANCDHYETQVIPTAGHSWDEGKVTLPPTEETEGERKYTCTVCGETKTEAIPVLEHVHSYETAVTAPTCTEQGYTTYTCACGDRYVDDYVDATGHNYASIVTAPTCTEQGYTTHTCANCGDSYVTDYVAATGHSYETSVTDPSCTEQGYTAHTCTVCGDSYQDSFKDALGHNWDEGVVTTQPTEKSEGVMTYTCTRCGETRMESIPVLEPEFNVTYSSVSLSLNGDIGVNYYMDLSQDITNDSGTYMEFTVNGVSQRVPLSEATLDSNGNYKFSCRVAAKQMTDTIVSQMYTSDGPVGASKEYSVQQYCNAVIDNYSQNAAYDSLIALLKAMVNYGAYAQLEFGYHIDNLANANLPEDEKGLPDNLELDAYAHSIVGSEEGIKVYSASLILESETVIRFYFQLTGDKTIEEYTFVINGKAVVPELSRDGTYYVDVPNISAKDLDTFYTVSVGGLRVSYCGISYVRMTLNYSGSSETLKELVRAVYAYNQAANTYFGA